MGVCWDYSPAEVDRYSAAQFIYEQIRPNQFYAIPPIGVIPNVIF